MEALEGNLLTLWDQAGIFSLDALLLVEGINCWRKGRHVETEGTSIITGIFIFYEKLNYKNRRSMNHWLKIFEYQSNISPSVPENEGSLR